MVEVWMMQVAGLVVLGIATKIIESKAAMRGCNRNPLPSWMDRLFRVIFLGTLAGPFFYKLDQFLPIPVFIPILMIYLVTYCDLSEQRCGRKTLYARRWSIWNYFQRRLNLKLVKSMDLDPSQAYIFGVHPHGVLPFGSMITLAQDRKGGFMDTFPGVDFRTLAATFCFYVPIYRDILLWGGVVDAARYSAHRVLSSGKSLALVPGGATEALYSDPRKDVVYLRKRGGFVKLALESGAHLVPVFSFNENNTYDIMGLDSPIIDKIKRKFQSIFGISLPLIKNIIPRKCNITVVVGKPLPTEKIENPTKEDVRKYLDLYIDALEKLYNDNREKYNEPADKPPLVIV